MKEEEFKNWLQGRGANTSNGRNTRAHAVRTIENNMSALGSPHADLNAAWKADGFDHLRRRLKELREESTAGGTGYRVLMPQSENPYNRLSSWRSWLGQYGQFLAGTDGPENGDRDEKDLVVEGLTRQAVEAAMDEFDEIGLDGFREEYGFGRPRDYWVRRPSNVKLYPAKATVGVAHGHIEGGRPLKVKEFHGGQGEQAANGILRGLGYEIVTGNRQETNASEAWQPSQQPTNLILYGPPGTGKTYATAVEAVKLCGEAVPAEREALMALYRSLQQQGRIGFVTFHQNFSYEDFVEGLRPVTPSGEEGSAGFELRPEPGIFRRMAEIAARPAARRDAAFSLSERRIFKLSLGESGKKQWNWVYEQSIEDGYALFGFRDVDWSDDRFSERDEILSELQDRFPEEKVTSQAGMVKSPDRFRNQLGIGDVVIISKGLNAFRAIGVIEGGYEYAPREDGHYCHRRRVRWLWEEPEGAPVEEISTKRFSLDTIYELPRERLNLPAIERYIDSADEGVEGAGERLPHVLIIDEINRANISKVFGELITLLEPDKRAGMPNALTVRLPYSKREFGVPANLHIIGTMNTADRSIALLDTALRRRFEFRELMPEPSLLNPIDDIDLAALLAALNERIEYLFDREHQIGHAYFIRCETRGDVDDVMRHKVIPLLAEYFYEDWSKVAAVLGDTGNGEGDREGRFLDRHRLKTPKGMDGDEDAAPRYRWQVRDSFSYDGFAGA